MTELATKTNVSNKDIITTIYQLFDLLISQNNLIYDSIEASKVAQCENKTEVR